MTAGRIVSKKRGKNRYAAGVDLLGHHTEVNPKYAAALLIKIGLRPGDNTDVMEALGLIPAKRITNVRLVQGSVTGVAVASHREVTQ